ncbi:MAG: signal peptidase I [Treponemataceae bacterium]|nr:MAG: signal peptidase I [Treponemataceae bacterium]
MAPYPSGKGEVCKTFMHQFDSDRRLKMRQYDYLDDLRKETNKKIFNVALLALGIIGFIAFFSHFFIFPVISKSDSMSPGFVRNSFTFVRPINKPEHTASLKRGDVVFVDVLSAKKQPFLKNVLNAVVSFVTFRQFLVFPENLQEHTFARIAGLPGDTVYMENYVLYVKAGRQTAFKSEFELSEKKYNVIIPNRTDGWDPQIGATSVFAAIVLKKDEYFLLCDNRAMSIDSRIWGAVHAEKIRGRAALLYFPYRNFSPL